MSNSINVRTDVTRGLQGLRIAAVSLATGLFLIAPERDARAKDVKAGNLVIEAPWSRATPSKAKVGVGYMAIINIGNASDTLKAASSPLAERVEIHSSSLQDGVMRMRRIEGGLEIKAQEVTEFKPGGLHLMLIGLRKSISKGETFPLQLDFTNAGKVDVTFIAAGIGARSAPQSLGIGKAGGSHSGAKRPSKGSK